ncbi:3-oxo-5-alpha-steroid 4-dehydrogenase-domain-containing protein [Choanephora cucurbitarum]|nr:3-oxo-5-alpha-steroid 4-dehydrogenase-domain-containing protein [Choanephora cucurbitarum]
MYIPEWNLVNACIGISIVLGSLFLIIRELYPSTQLAYSKFSSGKNQNVMVSSKYGMLLIYTPSLVITGLFLLLSYRNDLRIKLVSWLSFLHYLKRVMEVLFVHRYSGYSRLSDNVIISLSYTGFSISIFVFSLQALHNNTLLSQLGLALFFVGEGLNLYHHWILRSLREPGQTAYKIPVGGFFDYVWCPHYTCEIISFIAFFLVTQHLFVLLLQLGSTGYLGVRAYNTKMWYQKKFKSVPHRACLVPWLF